MRLQSPWWLSLPMGMPFCSLLAAKGLTLVLPGNTCLRSAVDASSTCSMTSKGQVTIPKALRQQLGLARGSRVCFELVGDHIEVRPFKTQQPLSASGFGLLKSKRPPVPVDFDPACLLRP